MHVVCAWCGKQLDTSDCGPISHGICCDCAATVEYESVSLERFLQALPAGTIVFDADVEAVGAHPSVLEVIGQNRDVVGRLGGDIICCVYASDPRGCGRTEHCLGCALRKTVTSTHQSGTAHLGARAFALTQTTEGVARLWLTITTERVGNYVLLHIDDTSLDTSLNTTA